MMPDSKPAAEATQDDLSDEQARRMIEKSRLTILEAYWVLGKKVIEERKVNDSGDVIERVAKAINLTAEVLLQAEAFVKFYPERKDLVRVAEKGLTWSHVRSLLGPHLSDATRRKLEERVAKEHLDVEEFTKEVKALIRRSGQTVMKKPETEVGVFVRIGQAADRLRDALKKYRRAKEELARMKGDMRSDTLMAKAEADLELRDLRFEINDIARDESNLEWWTKR